MGNACVGNECSIWHSGSLCMYANSIRDFLMTVGREYILGAVECILCRPSVVFTLFFAHISEVRKQGVCVSL